MEKLNYYFMANLSDGRRVVSDGLGNFVALIKDDVPVYEGTREEMLSALDRVVRKFHYGYGYDPVIEAIDAHNGCTILRVGFDPNSAGWGSVCFVEC